MRRRLKRTDVALAAGPAVAIAVLVLAGLHAAPIRAYSLQAPNQFPLVALHRGYSVCEGPIVSPQGYRYVSIWGAAQEPGTVLRITVETVSGAVPLGTGRIAAVATESEQRADLSHVLSARVASRVCVSVLTGVFSIAGAPAVNRHVVMSGRPRGREFSLLLLSQARSLLASLPLAFARASLFRLSWVGGWTFWCLTAALLATFGLALAAARQAGRHEEPPETYRD